MPPQDHSTSVMNDENSLSPEILLYLCETCEFMYRTLDEAIDHIHTASAHAAALVDLAESGEPPEAYMADMISVLSVVTPESTSEAPPLTNEAKLMCLAAGIRCTGNRSAAELVPGSTVGLGRKVAVLGDNEASDVKQVAGFMEEKRQDLSSPYNYE